jgi:hypothetical protein
VRFFPLFLPFLQRFADPAYTETGGTWVHWCQAFVWTELVKYGLDTELIYTPNADYPEEVKAVIRYDGAFPVLSRELSQY